MEDTLRSGKRQKNFRYFLLIALATPQAFAFFHKKDFHRKQFSGKSTHFPFFFPPRASLSIGHSVSFGGRLRGGGEAAGTSNVGKKKTEVIAIVRKRAFSLSHTSEPAGT